jgi:hypothetical protein
MTLWTESWEDDRSVTTEHLSEAQFAQLTEQLIYGATANGTLPSDALAALAKALGVLLAFAARRDGLDEEVVLRASQNAVADYATAATIYMSENAGTTPAMSREEQSC